MAEGYTPRVGDKVRATLGESVIVGRHTNTMHNNGVHIAPEGADFPLVLRINDGWVFEQLVSVPSKFGAVIRRADGRLFVRRSQSEYTQGKEWRYVENAGVATDFEDATAGGFTVLFEGVDE